MRAHSTMKWLITLVAAASLPSCAARYHTLHKELGVGEDDQSKKGADSSKAVDAIPTAEVEVIVNGNPTNKVTVGENFTIRPTEDTLDPDNGKPADCRNPGIVKADYTVSDGAVKNAARVGAPCTPLEVPHVIVTPGTYTVTMKVTSDENETAQSTMTLVVVPVSDTSNPGGFVVTADPTVVNPSEDISFSGVCEGHKKITWNYADGQTGEGAATKHGYTTAGSYEVKAVCERPDGTKQDGSVTVVVVPKNPETPGTPPGVADGTGDGPGTDADGDGGTTDGTGDGPGNDAGGDGDGGTSDGNDGSDGSDGDGDDGDDGDGGTTDGGTTDGNADDDDDDDPTDGGGDGPGQNPHQGPVQTPVQKPTK